MCYYPKSLRLAVLLVLAISVLTITADEAASQSPDNYRLMVVPESFEYVLAPGDTLGDSIYVFEDSGQVVQFEITNQSDWLFLPLFFTCPRTPTTIPFIVSASELPPGQYFDTITVTLYVNCETYHSHVTVPVRLTVSGGTETGLASEPSSFHFVLNQGDTLVGESLYIYDIEGNSYNFWTYNFSSWLYVDTMEASPLFTPELISVDVYTDMMSPGVYYDSILVFADEAANSPLVIPATLTIRDDSSEYVVQTSPSWFFFDLMQGDTGFDSLYVYEKYGRSVPFAVSTGSPWLSVYDPLPEPPYMTPQSLTVMVETDMLEPGIYYDSILIGPTADGDTLLFPPVTVPVMVTVRDDRPVVRAIPDHFEISLYPDDTAMNLATLVYEQSGASVRFWAETVPGSDWLHIQYPDTTGPFWYTPDSLYFDIFAVGLTPGVYADTIVIYDPLDDTVAWEDVRVPVVLRVLGGETILATNPTSFNFALNQGDSLFGESLYVYEIHGQSIGFWAYNQSDWLEIDTTPSIPLYTPDLIYLNVQTAMLEPGYYMDTVFVISSEAHNSPLAVPVFLEITSGETRLLAQPNYFDVTLSPGDTIDLSMVVYEPHGGEVPFWPVTTLGSEWLHVRDAGTMHMTPDSVSFYIIAGDLEPGVYADTIAYLDSAYGDHHPWPTPLAPVVLRIEGAPPEYVVGTTPTYLRMTAPPGDTAFDSLYVFERYGRNVLFMFYGTQPWLRIYDPSPMPPYITPASLLVSADASLLEPGTYIDTIVIAPEYEVFDTVRVPVTFVVGEQVEEYVVLTEPESFSWTLSEGDVAYDSLYVYEQYGRYAHFMCYNSTSWLTVNPFGMPPYILPMSLPVVVRVDSLPPGTYVDTIMIVPVYGTVVFQPVAVPVTLTVGGIVCGDVNGDGHINIIDVSSAIDYLYRSKPVTNIYTAGDVDGSGDVNLLDVTYLIDYLYKNGPEPEC